MTTTAKSAAALAVLCASLGCDHRRRVSSAGPAPDGASPPDARPHAGDATPLPAAHDGPASDPERCSEGSWHCEGERCELVGDRGGLPAADGSWLCHLVRLHSDLWGGCGGPSEWLCYGHVPVGSAPPGDCGWRCEQIHGWLGDGAFYRCQRPPVSFPLDATAWPACKCVRGDRCVACDKSSFAGGTRCYLDAASTPEPPPRFPVADRDRCEPGARFWCDARGSVEWGQVTCKPDGSWPTVMVSGKQVLDCKALGDSRGPATLCACYHPFSHPSCCERSDCRIPDGTSGWRCPKSAGEPCDYCLPAKPECNGGSTCVSTSELEAFCVADCGPGAACPPGMQCQRIESEGALRPACVPDGSSCYWSLR